MKESQFNKLRIYIRRRDKHEIWHNLHKRTIDNPETVKQAEEQGEMPKEGKQVKSGMGRRKLIDPVTGSDRIEIKVAERERIRSKTRAGNRSFTTIKATDTRYSFRENIVRRSSLAKANQNTHSKEEEAVLNTSKDDSSLQKNLLVVLSRKKIRTLSESREGLGRKLINLEVKKHVPPFRLRQNQGKVDQGKPNEQLETIQTI